MAETFLINDLRGGRNGFDPPHLLPLTQVVEGLNIDTYGAALARRRGGSAAISLTGGTAPGKITRLYKFLPGSDEGAAQMWSTSMPSSTVLVKRLAGGTSWADVTGGSLITTATQALIETATLDGRFYLAANSATGSRLLVYDPNAASPQLRYTGFTHAYGDAIPGRANTGSGAIVQQRAYRVRWIEKQGTVIVRRSDITTNATGTSEYGPFTPSGTGAAVRVTQPTPPGEGETHWELEGASVTTVGGLVGSWYLLATTIVATTTVDDSVEPSLYPVNYPLVTIDDGDYANWPNVRFIISDGNRLIGAGSHKTGEKTSRIYYSAVLGSTDQGDAVRVVNNSDQKNYVDLNEADGGAITGLAYAVNGTFYAFKRRQIWRLNPTGDVSTPYLPRLVTSAFGAISHASITAGRDVNGNPAIYFWSEEGPCRIVITSDSGAAVVQYLGEDLKDYTAQITFAGFTQAFPCSLYVGPKHQVWMWFSYTSGGNEIPVRAVFDIMRGTTVEGGNVRGGWSLHTDFSASSIQGTNATAAVMFAKTLGSTMSTDQVPYISVNNATAYILRGDTTDPTDNGQNYQAYIRSRPLDINVFGDNLGIGVCSLLADVSSGVTITLSLIRDYGLETRTSTVSLTAAASETKVIRKFEAAELSGAGVVQIQLGDSAAVSAAQWVLHALDLTYFLQEPR